jgi:hypothetical protein
MQHQVTLRQRTSKTGTCPQSRRCASSRNGRTQDIFAHTETTDAPEPEFQSEAVQRRREQQVRRPGREW